MIDNDSNNNSNNNNNNNNRIRMRFGTSKCAILIMEGGPISRREDIQL